MNWRIVVAVVVLLGAIGYFIYRTATSPAYRGKEKSSVVLQHYCKALLDKRDIKKASTYCSRPAAGQSHRLLVDLSDRQKADPNFQLAQFRIQPPPAAGGRQVSEIHLIDSNRTVFLVVDCALQQMPDNSWKIVDVQWRPLVMP
jgi:hypothetical protein